MQHTLFIADLHLDERHKLSTKCFINFIDQQAQKADALYILGDFFELWIGDDHETPFNKEIKNSLISLSEKNIPIFFVPGNRDFLVGKKFAQETGCKILPQNTVIPLYGDKVVLLHGDGLCTHDLKHMKFRRLTQNPFIRSLFLALPLSIRKKIGLKMRATSRKHHSSVSNELLQVNEMEVSKLLEENQVNYMIHGHIHEPKIFHYTIKNQPAERIVLGSWEQQGCALKWFEDGKKEMYFFD